MWVWASSTWHPVVVGPLMWALVTSKAEATPPTLCHVASAVSQVPEVTSKSKLSQSQRKGMGIGAVKAVLSAWCNLVTWEMVDDLDYSYGKAHINKVWDCTLSVLDCIK